MTKTTISSAILLLLCSAVVRAGILAWAPVEPYPVKGDCQPISFDQPDAIAVDKADNIYIANETGPNAVQEISVIAGTIRTLLSRSAEPIESGHYFGISLALGPKGDLFLAVKQRGTVERLNSDDTLTLIAGKPGDRHLVDGPKSQARLNAPNAIAIRDDGMIYVADTRTIRKIRSDGSIATLAGNPNARNPNHCYEGCPYVADAQGRHAVFMSPNGIAVDANGNIYVADGYDGEVEGQAASIGLLRKVTARGDVSTVAGTLNTTSGDFDDVGARADFDYVFGVAVDSSANIYVTEPFKAAVRKIDADRRVSTVIAERSPSYLSTGLMDPAGIAVSDHNSLFVIDDLALPGLSSLTAQRSYWLHHVVNGTLQTLCEKK